KLLNDERAPAPRACGWAPSTVKGILDRRLYLGEVVWNRRKKRNAWGQQRVTQRPPADWITHQVPDLPIVSDPQWRAAQDRLGRVRARLVDPTGRPLGGRRRDIESIYLLSGFARCAICGGGFGVTGGSHSSNRRHTYGCLSYHKRGRTMGC